MTSVQERLQLKREPIDKWSVREQLCLASAVCRSGDQNWMSVSRALKPFGEPNRPSDWFHQKNCAAQYGMLLGNVETPKRKNKKTNGDSGIETPAESILKRLLAERQAELKKLLAEEKAEYQKLQKDMLVLQSGKVSEEQLDKWCQEIEEEENRKEQESIAHAQWLKEREIRKQEIEKAWRPTKVISGQKRKNSDIIDNLIEQDTVEEVPMQVYQAEPAKPGLSPLLTSLLKSPSQAQNTPILHTAITSRPLPNTNANPMIASLLNSSTNVTVSPSLQQLVSSAIGQETPDLIQQQQQQQQQQYQQIQQQQITNDILDDANLPNIKIDDLANSILVQDGPLPEIKKEEVDDIISEIIQADPEQQIQLDGNGDININLELDDFDDEEVLEEIQQQHQQQQQQQQQEKVQEIPPQQTPKEEDKKVELAPTPPVVDPFEFQEDPIIHLEPKPKQDITRHIPQYIEPNSPVKDDKPTDNKQQNDELIEDINKTIDIKEEKKEDIMEEEPTPADQPKVEESVPGSVEIVEVVVTDDEDNVAKSEVVSSVKSDDSDEMKVESSDGKLKSDETETESKDTASVEEESSEAEVSEPPPEVKIEPPPIIEQQEPVEPKTEIDDELFDEMNMEVKFDKSGKKRDYSRTKKKEEKGFDILLAIEKANMEESDITEETLSDIDKKDAKVLKIKSEIDRSNSPWAEEDGVKRRYSTPVTPTDSIPNSPASTNTFLDDDREYRNWKKSVMLVYNRLATHKYASLFLKPITDEQAPGYSNAIYRPMDLMTIKKNIENGSLRSTLEFKRDTMLMFTNAIMYNRTNSLVYSMALEMQKECVEPIEILLNAETHKEVSLRRETRTSDVGTKRKRTLTDELLIKSTSKKRKDD